MESKSDSTAEVNPSERAFPDKFWRATKNMPPDEPANESPKPNVAPLRTTWRHFATVFVGDPYRKSTNIK